MCCLENGALAWPFFFFLFFPPASRLRKQCVSHSADKGGEWGPSGSWCHIWPQLYSHRLHYSWGCERGTSFFPWSAGGDQAGEHSCRQLCGNAQCHWPRLPSGPEHKVIDRNMLMRKKSTMHKNWLKCCSWEITVKQIDLFLLHFQTSHRFYLEDPGWARKWSAWLSSVWSLTRSITMTPQTNQSLGWARKHSFRFSDISPYVSASLFIFHCSSPDSLTVFSRKTLAHCSASKVSAICLIYHLFACLHNRKSFGTLITQIVCEVLGRLQHLLWSWADHYLTIIDIGQAGTDYWLGELGLCPGAIRDLWQAQI